MAKIWDVMCGPDWVRVNAGSRGAARTAALDFLIEMTDGNMVGGPTHALLSPNQRTNRPPEGGAWWGGF